MDREKFLEKVRKKKEELKEKLEKRALLSTRGNKVEQIRSYKRVFDENLRKKIEIKKETEKKLEKLRSTKTISRKSKSRIRKYSGIRHKKSLVGIQPNFDDGVKPNIAILVDVEGWAWWIKSQYLIRYLSDDFNFTLVSLIDGGKHYRIENDLFDLYLTFGYSYIPYLRKVPFEKRISGVTAHRGNSIIQDLKSVKWLHANSILLRNFLLKSGFAEENVFYVPNGVDTEMFYSKKPINPNSELIVGHIGKISPLKGQKEIIEPAVKASKVKYFSHYNTWEEKIPYDKMVDLYQNIDLFIVASTEDGTPCPALEAAACGRPILSNAIGNMPEFIVDGYNGFIVKKDISEYVNKIKWLKNHKKELVRMGYNARKTAIEWDWCIQAENYRDMFTTILLKIGNHKIEKLQNRIDVSK